MLPHFAGGEVIWLGHFQWPDLVPCLYATDLRLERSALVPRTQGYFSEQISEHRLFVHCP